MFVSYFEGAIKKLTAFEEYHGEAGIQELNAICYAHVITIDHDEETAKRISYCGCDVVDGKLRIVFQAGEMGTNMYGPFEDRPLEDGLTLAAAPPGATMSYAARANIRLDYDRKIEETRKKIAAILQKPDVKLVPNFEATFEKLVVESQRRKNQLPRTWQREMGDNMRKWFEGVAHQLKRQNFGDDELLREGFHDAVDKGVIAFRIVDEIADDQDCGCAIEDGVLYLQVSSSQRRSDQTFSS